METLEQTLTRAAVGTTAGYFQAACRELDEKFGEGYAKNNPCLVAEFIRSSVLVEAALRFERLVESRVTDLADVIAQLRPPL